MLPTYFAALAEGHLECGQFDEARQALQRGFDVVEQTGGASMLAELWRLRARLYGADASPTADANALDALRNAMGVAREQGSIMFEQRAACDDAERLADQGRVDEARELLAALLAQARAVGAEDGALAQAEAMLATLADRSRGV